MLTNALNHPHSRYGVIGNPIGHSRSPLIHQAFAAQTGLSLIYTAILAPLDGFEATVAAFRQEGGRGLNVTVPFKAQAFALCHTLSERAARAGAVNTLIFPPDPQGNIQGNIQGEIQGDNTDGVGLLQDFAFQGIKLLGEKVLLLGAGGASRGVLAPLLAEQPAQLRIANRREKTAQALIADFADLADKTAFTACALDAIPAEPFDVIINATSAGLSDTELPLPEALIHADTVVYDMAYGHGPTVFMRWGQARGAQAFDGLGMLVEQAAQSFYLWHGIYPDTRPVRDLLRAT
ncbi:MAG: shikimate dehydrogenase [Halothiobacillus sp. 20-53-49]|nr:MAG: shikimate dehydrogenase [Halothiobacillus sp. 20-53-49]HUM98984.1 shikimate dehydrogenase [Halothiobacillus sp.]